MPKAIPEILQALDVEYTVVTDSSAGTMFGQKLSRKDLADPRAAAGMAWLEKQCAVSRVALFQELCGAISSDKSQLTDEIRQRIIKSASLGGNWRNTGTWIDFPVLDMMLKVVVNTK